MKVKKFAGFWVITILAVFPLLLAGCGPDVPTVMDAWVSEHDSGEPRSEIYSNVSNIYAFVELDGIPETATVKVVWTAIDVADGDPNTVISESEERVDNGLWQFEIFPDDGSTFLAGSYKADIYLEGSLVDTLLFVVE